MTGSGYEIEGVNPVAASPEEAPAPRAAGVNPVFDRDKFLLHQKHLSLSEKYRVYDEQGEQIMFVHRNPQHLRTGLAILAAVGVVFVVLVTGIAIITMIDNNSRGGISDPVLGAIAIPMLIIAIVGAVGVGVAVGPKRHITFYGDESMSVPLLNVFQDQKWQIPIATYTVADPEFNMIGLCRKNYIHNILRKKWECYGPDGQVLAIVREDSLIESLLRRFLGSLFGALRTNYRIYGPDGRTQIGAFNRNFTLLDKYVLDMSNDGDRRLDRRLAAAIGVLLDTGERR